MLKDKPSTYLVHKKVALGWAGLILARLTYASVLLHWKLCSP